MRKSRRDKKSQDPKSKTQKIAFLDGRFLSEEEARGSVAEPGFLYGWGVFETMRLYKKRIVYLEKHLERIKDACRLINIRFNYNFLRLKKIIYELVKKNEINDAYIKLAMWKKDRGTGILVIAKKYQPYPNRKYKQGFCVCISSLIQNQNNFLVRIKSMNYLFYQLAYLEAKKRGFEEAVILNTDGYITEASRSNLFLVKDNQVFTPSLSCGCLDGITRRVVFDIAKRHNIKISEGNLGIQDLYNAEEAFLTNSLVGVMPLTTVEKRRIAMGRITKFFMQEYNYLLKNGI